MKYWICIFFGALISCNANQQNVTTQDITVSSIPATSTQIENKSNNDIYWTGLINGKMPVFIHYRFDDSLIIGEITYTSTKNELPITLLGTIEQDKSYRLLEFEHTGNITGIITGQPTDKSFIGTWVSPKTEKEFPIVLTLKDTILNISNTQADLQSVFGHYHYQYTEAGSQGDLDITKISDSRVSFGITSVTGEPSRNVAQIDEDTIKLKQPQFTYKLPGADDCEFEVKFYKGFAYIKYTKGFCDGQFGMNATIDGIFIKTK